MSDMRPLRNASASPLTRALLASGRRERPTAGGKERTVAAVGIAIGAAAATVTTGAAAGTAAGAAAGAGSAAGTAAGSGTAAASKWIGGAALAKWVAAGVVSTAVVVGAVNVPSRDPAPAVVSAPAVSVVAPVQASRPALRVAAPAPSASAPVVDEPVDVAVPAPPIAPAVVDPPVVAPPARARVLAPKSTTPALDTPASVQDVPAPQEDPRVLRQETELIGRAHAALARGDAPSALRAIEAHDRAFPNGVLAEEAQALRIEALERAGQHEAASAEAARFLARAPNSPHARRVRAIAAGRR